MLPTAALPTSLASSLSIEPGPQGVLPTAENKQFQVILADTLELAVAPLTTLQDLAATAESELALAATLPESGKELPEPATVETCAPDTVVGLALAPSAPPRIDLPATPTASQDASPLEPAPRTPAAATRHHSGLNLDQLHDVQPALAPLSAGMQARMAAASVEPALPSIIQAAAAPLAPVALAQNSARKLPVTVLTTTSSPVAEIMHERPAATAIDAILGMGITQQPQAQPLALVAVTNAAPTAPFTPPATVQGPQGFSQLIDRLVAARESAQPQTATVALAHADFGPVELRFSPDSQGLSVTMASSDPDFARAVQAAVPPVSAASDSTATQARSQGQGSAPQGGTGGGQSQGQPGGNGPSPGTAQNRPATRNPGGTPPEAPGSQQGIFA